LLFVAIITVILIGVWQFLQTDFFGRSLSKSVDNFTKNQANVSVSFENLDFQFFPPGARLNNVKINADREEVEAEAYISSLGVYFNLMDSFKTKLTIKELSLEDAAIHIKELKSGKKSEGDFKVTNILEFLNDELPVSFKKAKVKDLNLKYKNFEQFINSATLELKARELLFGADLRNIDLGKFSKVNQELDRINLMASLSDKKLDLRNLEIYKGVNKLETKGVVTTPFSSPKADLTGNLFGEVSELHKYLDFERIGKIDKGVLKASFKAQGDISNYEVITSATVSDFKSDFAYGETLSAELKVTPNELTLLKASLIDGKHQAKLTRPFKLFNIKNKSLGENRIYLRANDLKLDNTLRYIRKTLSPLKGELSGDIIVEFGPGRVRFFSEKSINVSNLRFKTRPDAKKILGAKQVELIRPVFSIVKGTFFMNSNAKTSNSEFKVVGQASKEGIDFVINQGRIALEDFGPYAGLDIKGRGEFSLIARGKGKNTVLKIKTSLENFAFQGYRLRQARMNVLFDFAKSELVVGSLGGSQGKARLAGELKLNYKTLDISANGNLSSQRYSDVKEILRPLLGDVSFVPSSLYGKWNYDFVVGGKATLNDLKLESVFSGENNYIYDEGFEFLGFKLELKNKTLSLNEFILKKSTGFFEGTLEYGLGAKALTYNLNVFNIPVAEISNFSKTPFAFNGLVSGKLSGKRVEGTNKGTLSLSLTETKLAGKAYDNSNVTIKLADDSIEYGLNFLGQEVVSRGEVFIRSGKSRSKIFLEVNSTDIQKPLGLLKFVDQGSLQAQGAVQLESKLSFDGLSFDQSDFFVNLKRLYLEKDKLKLNYANTGQPQIIVKKGEIQRWNIELGGRRVFLVSKGSGTLGSSYDIDNKFKIDASILEVFNSLVSSSSGTIRAKAKFYKNIFKEDYEAKVIGNEISLSSDKLPTEISNSDFAASYKNKKLDLMNFKAQLSSGQVLANGSIIFSDLTPDVELNLRLVEAGFPILKKSNLVISGDAKLTGNQLPYSLTGEVQIQKLLIMNEIADFTRNKKATFVEEFDYLPEQVENVKNNFVNMNVDISTVSPILINNSLADIGLIGRTQVLGGEENFKMVGKLSLAPRTNKITFKNNEYLLTKAQIFFDESSKVSNPELDIAAHSVINDYKVNIKVFGPVDNFNLELTSEPALTQEDVLSLIAFGYTEDLSSNLSDQEKEAMTRAGVGSIIFDSFKINETLKNEFGLEVNLGTEITEEERSYLSRVNNDSAVGRVSSATTIEVKKKLNDAMNLSVTSTVGGGIGQKQSMNLNYNINEKLSFEGVYETRTSDEGEETINDSSLGADVKIRWSFR
tara:strand:+ start:123225 stop:127208 length:3984 start_codon:yes stop_codon:yes gene_type:complete